MAIVATEVETLAINLMAQISLKQVADEWYEPLYRFALSLSKNPDDAMDLTQSAFFKLTERIEQIRDPSRVKSWLFSVVHRAYIDQYRHHSKFPKDTIDSVPEPAQAQNQTPGDGNDTELILQALQGLDNRFRAPLTLYYFNNFSYREIAETLDIPIGTVMSRLRRAKDQLRYAVETPEKQQASQSPIPFKREANHG